MKHRSIFAAISTLLLTGPNALLADGDPARLSQGGTWDLVGWTDKGEITSDPSHVPTLSFGNGRIEGSGGVNHYGGSYRAKADGGIRIGEVAITQMAATPELNKMEEAYMDLLGRVTHWKIDQDTLILSDGTEAHQLRFRTGARKVDRPLEHLEWKLKGIRTGKGEAETHTPAGEREITFEIGDGNRISGSAGVNRYSGKAETDGKNGLVVGPLITTRMGGPPEAMERESAYLEKLQAVTRWKTDGSELTLTDDEGTFALIYGTR